jgi:hypothetical protein
MVARLIGFIFGGIGLLQLIIALGFGLSTTLAISSSVTANGVVIDGGNTSGGRKVTGLIEFTASNGQVVRFRSPIASSPPEFQTGQQVKVYYKTSDPAGSAMVDSLISLWFWTGLFGILGLVSFSVGLVSFSIWYAGTRKRKWLLQHGHRITAEVTEVKKNPYVHNMGKSPYYILARSRETINSVAPVFKSGNVWNLPATVTPGADVSVLVDPTNYRRYYVDVPEVKK